MKDYKIDGTTINVRTAQPSPFPWVIFILLPLAVLAALAAGLYLGLLHKS